MPRYNSDPNPYFAVDATGASTSGTSGFAGTRLTAQTGLDRATAYQLTQGGSAGTGILRVAYRIVAATPGQAWSSTLQLRSSAAIAWSYYVEFVNSAGAQVGLGPATTFTSTANVPFRLAATGTAPANTTHVNGIAFTTAMPASSTIVGTAHRIEQILDPNIGPGDGASGNGWAWDGTAGTSTSTRTVDDGGEWWALLAG